MANPEGMESLGSLTDETGKRAVFGEEVRARLRGGAEHLSPPDPDVRGPMTKEKVTDYISSREVNRARRVVRALLERKMESLRLFEPLPLQEAFFRSSAPERVFLGGNQAGKTLVGAVECVRAICGADPYGKWPKDLCRFIAVGKDLDHCGETMWRKMSWEGQFRVIRDEHTGEWRAYRPWLEYDVAYKEKALPAPPLLPARMIKSISWERKKDDIPKKIKLTNRSELTFYSSEALPRQGIDCNGIWFDEEILSELWYTEACPRLIYRNGLFYWTATPQAGTVGLYDLASRAEQDRTQEIRGVECFQASMLDNPFLTEDAKRRYLGKIRDANEYAVRVEGKFALAGLRVYPEFQGDTIHGCESFEIPRSWTRYAAVDPGVQVCGVLFFAVAPASDTVWGGKRIVYDEAYIQRCDARRFGEVMKLKCMDQSFYSWVIDLKFGRQRGATGKSWAQHYAAALRDHRLECERTGSNFSWSSGDLESGIESVRKLLAVGPDGPSLVVMRDRCPMLIHEVERYTYIKKPSGEVTDTPVRRKYHMMDCLRYGCETGLRYHKPRPKKAVATGAVRILEKKREKDRIKKHGGPGPVGVSLG